MLRKHPGRTGLARVLSKSGYCSRSSAGKLICEGRVRLNGRLVRDPEKPVVPGHDSIEVDGHKLGLAKRLYFVMNKPRGIVTSASDEKGRDTVYSLLPEVRQWVAPVGRLDKASEGLLLLTNDSEWSARMASPERHIEKTYHVQVAAVADEELIQHITSGMRVASSDRVIGSAGDPIRPKARSFAVQDGDFLRVKRAAIVRVGKKNSWLEIVLDEGKNRQIRRLLAALGIEVLRLVRIAIGPLQLGDLPKGKVRELTQEERPRWIGQRLARSRIHEGKFGKDPRRRFQVLQIVQRKIGPGVVLCQTFAANLDHSQQMLLRINHRRGHQLLDGVGAGSIGLPQGAELNGFEDIRVLHDHKIIEEFNFAAICGASRDRRSTRERNEACCFQFHGKEKIQYVFFRSQQRDFRPANVKQVGQAGAGNFRRSRAG